MVRGDPPLLRRGMTDVSGWRPAKTAGPSEFAPMPSLIRLIMVLGLLGGLAYGAMFALANFVQPKQREMTITIPPQKLVKPN